MSKLYFRYGAMNCGKTTALLQVANNYEERGMKVVILKPEVDTKGGDTVVTRIGPSRKVDHLVGSNENLSIYLNSLPEDISCILVDECQFINKDQIDELFIFCKTKGIPVICYGLRSDFKTIAFPGSLRLFEIADVMEVLFSIASKYGYSEKDLLDKRNEKKTSRGGFEKNIVLKKTY